MSARPPHIDVVVASLDERDGVSFDSLQCHAALKALGVESHLFCDYNRSAVAARQWAHHYLAMRDHSRPDAVLYVYSVQSPISMYLRQQGWPVVLRYQNITPPHFFEPYDPEFARHLAQGREELAQLCAHVFAGICPSRFNASELENYGVRQIHVVANFCRLKERTSALPPESFVRLLFVGRVVPNKCQHELVDVASRLCRTYGRKVELVLAGSTTRCSLYASLVREYARNGGVPVHVLEEFSEQENVYTGAHFYLSLSEHEGFGMPLVEAMSAGVPVLAYGAAAVPEVVGDGGVVFDTKDKDFVAALIEAIVHEPARWQQLAEAGVKRAGEFRHHRLRTQLAGALRSLGFEVGDGA
ncbi:MAG: glycosyltransferase [Candidatus Sumerlaeaceae bacterium]